VNFLQNRRVCHTVLAVALLIATSASIGQLHSAKASIGQLHPAKRSAVHVGSIPSRELLSRPLDTSIDPPILLFFPANFPDDDRCGNSPLPCAPSDNPRLRLRVPGNLGGGFYLE
jgi:hypothetical protein